jgi:hypothetical protein
VIMFRIVSKASGNSRASLASKTEGDVRGAHHLDFESVVAGV